MASTGKVKMGRLWTMSKDELGKHMEEIKKETQQMRTQKVTGGSGAKLNRIGDLRKQVARINTVQKAHMRGEIRKFYKGKKRLPLDLRPKQTRAKRRQLTKHEAGVKTQKQRKKDQNFPMRMYAIKAEA